MSFTIQHSKFEGPIHLLLHLIEEHKLHISEISLANVTQEYISYIETNGKTIKDSSQFVVVAATLLLIKARSLLPNLEVTDDETKSIETLVNRIELLQMIRERSHELSDTFGTKTIFARALAGKDRPIVFAPHETLSAPAMLSAIKEIIAILPIPEKLREASVQKVIKIEEVIEDLVGRFQSGISYSFNTALSRYKNSSPEDRKVAKHDAIVTFLALLELARKGIAALAQQSHFSDIEANSTPVSNEATIAN